MRGGLVWNVGSKVREMGVKGVATGYAQSGAYGFYPLFNQWQLIHLHKQPDLI